MERLQQWNLYTGHQLTSNYKSSAEEHNSDIIKSDITRDHYICFEVYRKHDILFVNILSH